MTYNFLVAPDFAPKYFAGWYMLNTYLQTQIGQKLTLHIAQKNIQTLLEDAPFNPPFVYANPFYASHLIQERGYRALARPCNKQDEMVIVAAKHSGKTTLDALKSGDTITMADNNDVRWIGLRLLEAVDLYHDNLNFDICDTYQAALRKLFLDKAAATFMIHEVYESLSQFTKDKLNVLIKSDIDSFSHVFLVQKDFEHADAIKKALIALKDTPDGQKILQSLGMNDGFCGMNDDEAYFMMDLMQTLVD